MTAETAGVEPVEPDLAELARAYGVAVGYHRQTGEYVDVDRRTVVAVLTALGADPSNADTIADSLRERRMRDWRRTLPPVFVTVYGQQREIWVHVPHGAQVHLWVVLESGGRTALTQVDHWVDPREIDGAMIGEARFSVPGDLPLGWHRVRAEFDDRVVESPLVVTPDRLRPRALEEHQRMWGLMAQIYAVRSSRSWEVGDLADLTDLATWSAHELGADFVLVNPLHAAAPNLPITPSPYLPSTRRFANPMYLRIEEIEEYAYLDAPARKAIRRLARRVARNKSSLIDRDLAWSAKREALDIVGAVPLTAGRQAAFDAFVAREGTGLVDMATWCSIAERHGPRWREWPAGLRRPQSPEVARWREAHAHDIVRHMWWQWLLDEQLAATQSAARRAGMSVGVIHDLAVGVGFDGSDAWALQDVLVAGVSVGAPPDMFNQRGQDWAQPPWHPDALADAGFIPFRDMLRTVLRHSGGLRIDHVLGMFRMWWIPEDMSPAQGTYVAFDHEALLGILALEAHRAGALVIGEDLGTVEPWVADVLRDKGLLGTCILWFERDEEGSIRPPEQWRCDVLASVSVHDLPPAAGYLRGEHVRLRHDLGLLTGSHEEERQRADIERREWVDLLCQRQLLDDPDAAETSIVVALHRVLAQSPARLLAIGLPDLVGDVRTHNQPGTDQEYPNWRLPLADAAGREVGLEDLLAAQALPDLVAAVTPVERGDALGWEGD